MPIAKLDRSIISLKGATVQEFLGGLTTNSMKTDLSFAALLTPQGKIIADFFVHKLTDDHLMIETPSKFGKTLLMRFKMYKLRAAIDIEDISETHSIYALWDGKGDVGNLDPRHMRLGQRYLTEDLLGTEHTQDDYDAHRLALGIPDSTWDFDSQQVFPADANMDLLHGLDLQKGCFIGQEVVSRMHRKSTIRKRMCGVKLSGEVNAGDEVIAGGKKIGTVNHVRNDIAIALTRLDRLAKTNDTPMVNDKPATITEPYYDT